MSDPKEPDNVPAAYNGGAGAAGDVPGLAHSVDPSIYIRHTGRGQGQIHDPKDTASGHEQKRLAEWSIDEAEKDEA